MPPTLTLRQLNRATLQRQLLLAREPVTVVEAFDRLCGMQAQEAKHPFAGLWTRVEGFRREDLRAELREGRVVRATAMRATLHLMSAAQYSALRPALQPALTLAMRGALRGRDEGLDIDALLPVARELLAREPRTFKELRALLVEAFPDVNDRALGYAVRTHLPLVMVPTDDRWGFPSVADFALGPPQVTPPDALEHLLRRYLAAFGPATRADVANWAGLPGQAVDAALERLALRRFRSASGDELVDLPRAPLPDPDTPAPVRFLPTWDATLLVHARRTGILPEEHRSKVFHVRKPQSVPTFLVDGAVRGAWRYEDGRIELEPFERLDGAAKRALRAEAERLVELYR